jgi:hypothetical protein
MVSEATVALTRSQHSLRGADGSAHTVEAATAHSLDSVAVSVQGRERHHVGHKAQQAEAPARMDLRG